MCTQTKCRAGQFDVRGDKRWQQQMASLNNLFGTPHVEDDWILIDDEDFQKYLLGRSCKLLTRGECYG